MNRSTITRLVAAAAAVAVVGLSGCSSDNINSTEPDAGASAVATDEPGSGPNATAGGDGSNRFGADLDQTAEAIMGALTDATDYTVNGKTLTITFSQGESEGLEGMMDCLSVGGLMNEGETLRLSYPDGTTTC